MNLLGRLNLNRSMKKKIIFFIQFKQLLNEDQANANNFVIVHACAKCSKLITSEENIIRVLKLLFCLQLFFVFFSEVLKRGIKAVLTELFFKMQFVKNVLIYVFGVFTFGSYYCFYEGFIPKFILHFYKIMLFSTYMRLCLK